MTPADLKIWGRGTVIESPCGTEYEYIRTGPGGITVVLKNLKTGNNETFLEPVIDSFELVRRGGIQPCINLHLYNKQ